MVPDCSVNPTSAAVTKSHLLERLLFATTSEQLYSDVMVNTKGDMVHCAARCRWLCDLWHEDAGKTEKQRLYASQGQRVVPHGFAIMDACTSVYTA